MTRSQKLMLLALALIAVVFALVIWHGATRPACVDEVPPSQPGCKPGGGIKSLGALTAPFTKSLKLPQPSYPVAPNTSVSVVIPAASDDMRSLKVKLAEGSAAQLSLANVRPDKDTHPEHIARQRALSRNSLPFQDDDHVLQRTMTLVVTDLGARLTMRCTGASRCVFTDG